MANYTVMANNIKKYRPVLHLTGILLIVLALAGGGCRRWSHHGDLDGMWQVQRIEYSADGPGFAAGEVVAAPQLYINVNLELLQLQKAGHTADLTGVLIYTKGSDSFGVDWRGRPLPEGALGEFGFEGDPSHADILTLNSRHLVFRTPVATVTCRKY